MNHIVFFLEKDKETKKNQYSEREAKETNSSYKDKFFNMPLEDKRLQEISALLFHFYQTWFKKTLNIVITWSNKVALSVRLIHVPSLGSLLSILTQGPDSQDLPPEI